RPRRRASSRHCSAAGTAVGSAARIGYRSSEEGFHSGFVESRARLVCARLVNQLISICRSNRQNAALGSSEQFLLFLTAAVLLNVSPGADHVFILGRTLAQGRRAGFLSSWG